MKMFYFDNNLAKNQGLSLNFNINFRLAAATAIKYVLDEEEKQLVYSAINNNIIHFNLGFKNNDIAATYKITDGNNTVYSKLTTINNNECKINEDISHLNSANLKVYIPFVKEWSVLVEDSVYRFKGSYNSELFIKTNTHNSSIGCGRDEVFLTTDTSDTYYESHILNNDFMIFYNNDCVLFSFLNRYGDNSRSNFYIFSNSIFSEVFNGSDPSYYNFAISRFKAIYAGSIINSDATSFVSDNNAIGATFNKLSYSGLTSEYIYNLYGKAPLETSFKSIVALSLSNADGPFFRFLDEK